MTPLSVVLIIRNEADNLPRCLASVAWADEIVVVDSHSTDGTREICERHGKVRFLEQEFLGYGPQKRFAVAQASHDWILNIDADEVLDDEMQASIRRLMGGDVGSSAGFYLTRTLAFMGRVFTRGRESRDRVLRLFDRRRGNFTEAAVHERVMLDGPTGDVSGRLIHYSYRDLTDYFGKFNAYTSLMANQMWEQGTRASIPGIVLRPVVVFLQYYLLRGNVLNGFPGFVYSLLSAHYKTVKYLKLYELQNRS